MFKKHLITVVGPTAVGKTALAIKLANRLNTEIVSADSRQFYREMSIGTAKPTPEELNSAAHHFINSHSIHDEMNVGDYEPQALNALTNIFKNNHTAIVVGGSGLYINSICNGFDDLPKASPELREDLNRLFRDEGIEPLQEQLKRLDPEYYKIVDLNNPQRLIRALEVCLSTEKPFSSYRTNKIKKRDFHIIKIGLNMSRDELYKHINHRVDVMIENGLLEEVKSFYPFRHLPALNTVGYTELFDFLEGKTTLEEAVDLVKQNTRRFAKRQLTWFRKDAEIKWFEPHQLQEILDYITQQTRS